MLLKGLVRNGIRDPSRMRYQLMKECFIALKRFSAPNVVSIEVSDS